MAPDKDKDKDRKAAREEHKVGYHAREPGRPAQRKLPKRRFHDFFDSGINAASHGEEPSPADWAPLPREDRAG
jgi:hypothetical protein